MTPDQFFSYFTWSNVGFYATMLLLSLALLAYVEAKRRKGRP